MVARTDFPHVPDPTFEDMQERFKDFFRFKKENGIIEARMHTDDGPAKWSYGMHNGLGKMFKAVGADRSDEVFILTGSDDKWIDGVDMEYAKYIMEISKSDPLEYAQSTYDHWWLDGSDLLWPLVYDLHIPTIGVINGPGMGHTEMPIVCDITLCTPDSVFMEGHFAQLGDVTGDGQFLVFQQVMGIKKANWATVMGKQIGAEEALELGLVNEVVPREKIMDRAWEIARFMMGKDRYARRLEHELMAEPWRRALNQDFKLHFAAESWAQSLISGSDVNDAADNMVSFKLDNQG